MYEIILIYVFLYNGYDFVSLVVRRKNLNCKNRILTLRKKLPPSSSHFSQFRRRFSWSSAEHFEASFFFAIIFFKSRVVGCQVLLACDALLPTVSRLTYELICRLASEMLLTPSSNNWPTRAFTDESIFVRLSAC